MRDSEIEVPPVCDVALTVDVIDDEIVLDGITSPAPTLSIEAAREAAQRLWIAATFLEAKRRFDAAKF